MRYCSTKWKLDRGQTIVLIGHGLGGLVIKSLIESLCFVGKSQEASCKAFKQNIKGIVFYNVPHTTSKEEFVNYCTFYTMMIEKLDEDFNSFNLEMVHLNERFELEMARLNERFEESIERDIAWWNQRFEKSIEHQRIILFAFVEGQKVQSCGYLSSFAGFSSLGSKFSLLVVVKSWNLRDMNL